MSRQKTQFKTPKSRSDTAVQGTNDSSVVSKCSMSSLGYFDDQFISCFVTKSQRRSPLINWGYYIRAKAIDQSFKCFLSIPGRKQIISLGAGFDSSYFRLHSQGLLDNVTYYEIDFPDLVKRKAALIKQLDELTALLVEKKDSEHDSIVLDSRQYKLLGVDLTQLKELVACLNHNNIDWETPTILLSEVVMTYMTVAHSTAVVKWAASQFTNAVFVTYEQICPYDAFGIVMSNHFKSFGSPLKAIETLPTEKHQQDRYLRCGWHKCQSTDMNGFYFGAITETEQKRMGNLEYFDEFEEWHLKCSHYMLLWAMKGTCERLNIPSKYSHCIQSRNTEKDEGCSVCARVQNENSHLVTACTCVDDKENIVSVTSSNSDGRLGELNVITQQLLFSERYKFKEYTTTFLKRYAHTSSVILDGQFMLIIGGFGEECGQHKRLKSPVLYDLKNSRVIDMCLENFDTFHERMFHTANVIEGNKILIVGGRQSPKKACDKVYMLEIRRTDIHVNVKNTSDISRTKVSAGTNEPVPSEIHDAESVPNDTRNIPLPVKLQTSEDASENFECSEHLIDSYYTVCCKEIVFKNRNHSELIKVIVDGSVASQNESLDSDTLCHRDVMNGQFCSEDTSQNCYSTGTSAINYNGNSDLSASPADRWRHTSTLINRDGRTLLVVFGGKTTHSKATNQCFILDVEQNSWHVVKPTGDIPSPRHSHSANNWNNNVIIAGGLGDDLSPLSSVHILNTESWDWKTMLFVGLMPRYSHSSHIIHDTLLLVGGVTALLGIVPGIAVLHLKQLHIQEYALPKQDPEYPIMLHNHSSILTGQELIITGGGGNCFSFGTHLNTTPTSLNISSFLAN